MKIVCVYKWGLEFSSYWWRDYIVLKLPGMKWRSHIFYNIVKVDRFISAIRLDFYLYFWWKRGSIFISCFLCPLFDRYRLYTTELIRKVICLRGRIGISGNIFPNNARFFYICFQRNTKIQITNTYEDYNHR